MADGGGGSAGPLAEPGSVGGVGFEELSKSPLRTVQVSVSIDGVHTDIVLTKFENALFCVVTQMNKIGTLVHGVRDGPPGQKEPTFLIKILMGKRDEVGIDVCAKQVCRAAAALFVPGPEVFLTLALRSHAKPHMLAVTRVVAEQLPKLVDPDAGP